MGVLGGGTLLATQVQADLDEGVDQRVKETLVTRPADTAPLKLNEFKLPKDLPLEIPPGAQISPDLSKLTLPKDIDLSIPNDLDLSGLNLNLPTDFELQLPPGTEFAPPGLKLPNGGAIKLPDGKTLQLPAGTKLDLPPEVLDRLLAQGLPVGTLPSGRGFDLRGLPEGLQAGIDPPQFNGGGSLHLPAGTEIQLPDGQKLPFPPGALAYAARYLLPAGTTFDIPHDATLPGGDMPLPRPRSHTQLIRDDNGASTLVRVETEITGMPARVRKGEPITVSGYVREAANGRGIAGAPVDIFMNESKRAPGVLVGQGVSDARGTFTITLQLPADKPAREYQLVNHAAAFVDASGRSYDDAWGDPPFATTASTTVSVRVPARDGLGASTPITGVLVDNTGAPVANAPVSLFVDGVQIGRPSTSSDGRFAATHVFTSGNHVVVARFLGTPYYDASVSAPANITIEDFAIEIEPILSSKPGGSILLAGRVLGKGAVAPERTVTIEGVFGAPTIRLLSDSAGRFSYSFATSPTVAPGAYTLTYALPDHGVQKQQTIEIRSSGKLSMSPPGLWDVEIPFQSSVTLVDANGAPLAQQPVRVTLSGPGGSSDLEGVTNAAGVLPIEMVPLRPTPGTYAITVRHQGSPYLEVATLTQTITLGLFEVDWDVPSAVVRGQPATGSATVRFAGSPYAQKTFQLDGFGLGAQTTDALGRIQWSVPVPADASLGPTTIALKAPDHPPRATSTRVLSVPKLTLETPESVPEGSLVNVSLKLTDDQGKALRDAPITITATSDAGAERVTVRTDSEGRWKGPLNVTTKGGNLSMSARYNGTDPYLGAQGVRSMSVQAPVVEPPGGAPSWLLPALGVAAIVGGLGVGAGAWLYGRRRARPVVVQEAPVAAAIARPSDIEIRFGIPSGEPAVWGVGDPLLLSLANVGDPGEFDVSWPGGSTALALTEGAQSSTTLRFPQEGEVTISAKRRGGDLAASTAQVRIVDYRKETAREFDLFLEKAQRVDPSLTRRSTPREIVWTLETRLDPAARPHLDELAVVMEFTNYSHYAVSREHYLRFVRASRALDASFAPPAPVAGAPEG